MYMMFVLRMLPHTDNARPKHMLRFYASSHPKRQEQLPLIIPRYLI